MTEAAPSAKISLLEELNFLLTNRIPRRLATRLFGHLSRIENPLLARAGIGFWRLFADLDLSDSAESRFASLHACFTRRLKEGARPIEPDPAILTSPCDALVGTCGAIAGSTLIQAKGLTYTLAELVHDSALAESYAGGRFVTLRLTASMYHRFHAPGDLVVRRVTRIAGDAWNVNPIAVRRIEKLFCRNERAVVECALKECEARLTLVPVAAILVAGIRLHARASYDKGEEMGWFEHGSTIIVLAPDHFALCDGVREGAAIRMGRPLLRKT
ncbi:MAG TPA: archaetidylserine decarboxylase [Stellaceae bacterium]|nr:archaetidylserine decarboxylase [Stellaceae bacterium]